MGKYKYTTSEKEINKVIKMNELDEKSLQQNFREDNKKLSVSIDTSEQLLRDLGYSSELKTLKRNYKRIPNQGEMNPVSDWVELVAEANKIIPYEVELEDILSSKEFEIAFNDLDRIKSEFANKVKMNKTDISFLILATALQTVRWILMPELGETIDKSNRMAHDDSKIKDEVKRRNKAFKDKHLDTGGNGGTWRVQKSEQKTWMDMVFNSVPYDATKGSVAIGLNMEGGYHRYKTLGHDPMLGWIFGTTNIMTDTLTLNSFLSYRIKKMTITNQKVYLPNLFQESKEVIDNDFHCLPAAVFAQGVHLKSDEYTKLGLPVPVLGVFSEKLAGKLYHSQYDALCLAKDAKKVGASAVISIIINMIIGLSHGLFYDEKTDGTKDLYEARTRKILMYSNVIASSSNLIAVYITKNPKKLDVGGLIVTISRLFSDIRFITKLKDEFISVELDSGMQKELNAANDLFVEFQSEAYLNQY